MILDSFNILPEECLIEDYPLEPEPEPEPDPDEPEDK